MGYGLVPAYQITDRFQQNALLEILPECRTDVKLYWHPWKQSLPALQQLTQNSRTGRATFKLSHSNLDCSATFK